MVIIWSQMAQDSLMEIREYYEDNVSFEIADLVEDTIIGQVEKIRTFPKSIPMSDIFSTARKLVISGFPYVAFINELDGNTLEVLDVVHTSRKLPKGTI